MVFLFRNLQSRILYLEPTIVSFRHYQPGDSALEIYVNVAYPTQVLPKDSSLRGVGEHLLEGDSEHTVHVDLRDGSVSETQFGKLTLHDPGILFTLGYNALETRLLPFFARREMCATARDLDLTAEALDYFSRQVSLENIFVTNKELLKKMKNIAPATVLAFS